MPSNRLPVYLLIDTSGSMSEPHRGGKPRYLKVDRFTAKRRHGR